MEGWGARTSGVWHDESERWRRTGHLDQGPCWCPNCIDGEIEEFNE